MEKISLYTNCLTCEQSRKSIFGALSVAEQEALNKVKRCMLVNKGDEIFQEGANSKGVYCIGQGKVKLCQMGPDGKDQILHLAMDGDVMGYRATLIGDVYSCSAVAMEKTHVCFIPKEVFIGLVEKNSKLALQIIHLFSNELKKIENNLTKLTQRPVQERIAQSLLLLKNKYGYESDKVTINVAIKREELANMAGTTRETATRVLYKMQEEGGIILDGKKIRIISERQLILMANVLDF